MRHIHTIQAFHNIIIISFLSLQTFTYISITHLIIANMPMNFARRRNEREERHQSKQAELAREINRNKDERSSYTSGNSGRSDRKDEVKKEASKLTSDESKNSSARQNSNRGGSA